MFSFRGKSTNQSLQHGFGFHFKQAIDWCHKREEVPSLLDVVVKICVFLVLICYCEALLWRPQLVGIGVSVEKPHVDHAVCPLLPQVPDDQAPLIIGFHHCTRMFVGYCSLSPKSFPAPHGVTWCDEGIVAHVSWR